MWFLGGFVQLCPSSRAAGGGNDLTREKNDGRGLGSRFELALFPLVTFHTEVPRSSPSLLPHPDVSLLLWRAAGSSGAVHSEASVGAGVERMRERVPGRPREMEHR